MTKCFISYIYNMTKTDIELAKSFAKYYQQQVEMYHQHLLKGQTSFFKDCYYTPDVLVLEHDQKLFALGDLHGDFEFLWYSLIAAKLINNNGKWIGRNSVVIQLGDMFDGMRRIKGQVPYAGERKILNFLKNLHIDALQYGGMVITMLGNHDVNRLITSYDDNGNPLNQNFHLTMRDERGIFTNIGLDRLHYNPSDFMSTYNRDDFSKNISLSRLKDANVYGLETEGFHRQLLASCATKLLLKVVWKDTNIGAICSHGEKSYNFISRARDLLFSQLDIANSAYGLNLENELIMANQNNDHFIILVNSLFSFYLRSYYGFRCRPTDLFTKTIIHFLYNLTGNIKTKSFVWCYNYDNSGQFEDDEYKKIICKNASSVLTHFNLLPDASICLSGHSGPFSKGIMAINETGRCSNFTETDMPIHNNTIIMTDVMGSRAFGDDYFDQPNLLKRQPQIVRLMLNRQLIIAENIIDKYWDEFIGEAESLSGFGGLNKRDMQHNNLKLANKVINPHGLKLVELQ